MQLIKHSTADESDGSTHKLVDIVQGARICVTVSVDRINSLYVFDYVNAVNIFRLAVLIE